MNDPDPPLFQGLSSAEANERLRLHGPNRFKPEGRSDRFLELLKTMFDPMAVMLLLAAGTYFLLGDARDGVILLLALVPVLGVDVAMEVRSREALKKLAQAMQPRARVLRDGMEKEVRTEELVPGDILLLREGEKVPADGVLLHCANLSMDESQLTGESEPQVKRARGERMAAGGFEEETLFFAGALVATGHAYGEVLQTGLTTRFGQIARLVAEEEMEPTPLQKKTTRLVRKLGFAASTVVVGVLVLELLRDTDLPNAFLAAVSLGIAAFPEEFPLVFTLFLSLGAGRLLRQGVLIKRLTSVETLGSTTVICVDKTGTLTQGVFALESHLPLGPSGSETEVLEASVLACELFPADPMEKAVWEHAKQHGIDIPRLEKEWDLVFDHDFDPVGKHMSHVWRKERTWRIVAKGSLEGILEHCVLLPSERETAERVNARLASQGARVLAVAFREAGSFSGKREEDERDLKLLGLLAFRDPIRPDVARAVDLCQKAGIRIKIITGDHLLTAHAVADAVGITHGPEGLINAADLAGLLPEEFERKVQRGVIFARVRPDQKHAIVEVLKKAGEVVAMTGDGINDAPALKKADIGIAMGLKGTDVARASADMVLLEDSFTAIERTVFEGRRIFVNIQRAFYFLLAFHVPIVGVALFCPLTNFPLLFMPIHLVWLQFIIHPISALVFEAESAPSDIMERPPRDPHAELLPRRPVVVSVLSGVLLTAATLFLFIQRLPEGVVYARSAGMAVLILGSLLLVWAERAVDRPWWRVPFPRTLRFWAVWLSVAVSLPVIFEVPVLAGIFQVLPLPAVEWAKAGSLALAAIGWRMFGWRSSAPS